jgi:hypothetical protein
MWLADGGGYDGGVEAQHEALRGEQMNQPQDTALDSMANAISSSNAASS